MTKHKHDRHQFLSALSNLIFVPRSRHRPVPSGGGVVPNPRDYSHPRPGGQSAQRQIVYPDTSVRKICDIVIKGLGGWFPCPSLATFFSVDGEPFLKLRGMFTQMSYGIQAAFSTLPLACSKVRTLPCVAAIAKAQALKPQSPSPPASLRDQPGESLSSTSSGSLGPL